MKIMFKILVIILLLMTYTSCNKGNKSNTCIESKNNSKEIIHKTNFISFSEMDMIIGMTKDEILKTYYNPDINNDSTWIYKIDRNYNFERFFPSFQSYLWIDFDKNDIVSRKEISAAIILNSNEFELETYITKNKNYSKLLNLLVKTQNKDSIEIFLNFGNIKTGYFFNNTEKYALIINYSINNSYCDFHILKFKNGEWTEKYLKEDVISWYSFSGSSKFIDYNFDGEKDIDVHYMTSNGAAIESHALFLKKDDSFKCIENFPSIGTPIIDFKNKKIKTLWACCVFSMIEIKNYVWKNDSLILSDSMYIENYPYNSYSEYYEVKNNKKELVTIKDTVTEKYINDLLNEFYN